MMIISETVLRYSQLYQQYDEHQQYSVLLVFSLSHRIAIHLHSTKGILKIIVKLDVMQSIERGEPEQGLSSIMAICSVL